MESAIAKWTLYDPYLSNLACNCPDDAAAADLLMSWQPVKLRTQEALRNHRVTKRAWAGCPLYLCTKVTDILRAVYPNDYWAPAPLDHPNRAQVSAYESVFQPGLRIGWLAALCDAFANYHYLLPDHHQQAHGIDPDNSGISVRSAVSNTGTMSRSATPSATS